MDFCLEWSKIVNYYYYLSPGDNPPERGRAVRKNAGPSKNDRAKLNHSLKGV